MNHITEQDIYDIIITHPYLLEEGLENYTLKHEKIYEDRTRADFIFENDDQCIVVEIKKNSIDNETFVQVLKYLNNETKKNPKKDLKCILVGASILNEVKKKIEKSEYVFHIKLLGVDIPTEIKICDKCRKANSIVNITCIYCSSRKFILDPFLFIN